MNIQKVFEAVKAEPDHSTIIVAVSELENQGYQVKVGDKYSGSAALIEAEGNGELELLPMNNGVVIQMKRNNEEQRFRIHFLDIDAICFTEVDSLPIIFNPQYTTGSLHSGKNN